MASIPKNLSPSPTPVERETYDFICLYVADHKMGPKLQEIADARGVSKVTAHFIVRQLERKGFVTRRPGRMRSILPVGKCACCGSTIGKTKAETAPDERSPASLPPRQRVAYGYIRGYVSTHGVAPTMIEIAKSMGTHKPAAFELVHRLADKGYINFTPVVARGIIVVGRCECCGAIIKASKKGTAANVG